MIQIRFFLFFFIFFSSVNAEIKSSIVGKIGHEIITEIDVKNEIKTLLILSKNEINEVNIRRAKDTAVKSIVNKLIKKNEIKKYKIENYNKLDLERKLQSVAKRFDGNKKLLENIFKQNNTSIEPLIQRFKIEMKWNSLIYSLYQNQLNINAIDIENDLRKKLKETRSVKEYKLSEIVISINSSDLNSDIKKIYDSININGFREAVKKFSTSDTAQFKGEAGWFAEDVLTSDYLEKIKKIKVGEVTEPIKAGDSIVIIKVDDTKITKKEDININKLKEKIIENKKNEKLNLYSRSHLSKLENTTLIDLYE